MKKPYTYVATLYYHNPPFVFKLKPLTYKQLLDREDLIPNNQTLVNIEVYNSNVTEVYKNNLPTDKILVPYEIKKQVGHYILDISQLTAEELEKLQLSIEIKFDKKFQTDTWNCKICQRKKLDRMRNCGFRNEKNKLKDFNIIVGDKLYTYCPIYDIDKELLSKAIECYNLYEKGFLPEQGGLYDQTQFFIIASNLVAEKVQKEHEKELQEMQQSSSQPSM